MSNERDMQTGEGRQIDDNIDDLGRNVNDGDIDPAHHPQIDAASDRSPKGDHNRRLALGMNPDDFAREAGVTIESLRQYELTSPDQDYDIEIARRVGAALDRMEADPPATQVVRN